ncbi:UDP-N-acetylmuramoyl-L-alanine--D-glutamate ligase [Aeromicrobium sp. YIM 150415]|uniref:UDP-N-acetylmuramoyl-L-alanine--D-glutamate ligase n=1 Tax=Aeromicrobium sp. YIM 150415 TaxID=2803912 RepID=UPI0027DD2A11|nr:UDP-N-acetylmuramoyl-L-alanine--D-glutamate ligase [Aeromicrobium sp. YIM 150415]
MSGIDVDALGRDDSWEGVRALVTGFGVSGFAAADTLTHLGASVIAVDSSEGDAARREQATLLRILGADVRLGPGATDALPDDIDIVVTSPGWRPDTPLLAEAAERGIPIWGEVELAWRLRGPDAAPWLVVTGTNGKTTTVQMLEQILLAAGLRARAVGNVGTPVLEAVMDPEGYDVLAVELSSFQLHWTSSMSAEAAAVLNIAPDHYDWHGGADAYAAAKGRVYENVQRACVYNVADPVTRRLVEEADVIEGARAIGFTRGVPGLSELGVVDDLLADRAFVENRAEQAAELGSLDDLYADAPHVIENALAAAALARAHGVEPAAVRAGLRAFRPGPHRVAEVGRIGGIRYVDDSKATNPHAAGAALSAVESAVWIAGGLAKGATFDGLVEGARDRLRAVVLIGRDRSLIAEALARHAPEVPVVEVETGEDDLMDRVVEVASSFAVDGDTVLLAPACASMDQFTDYAQRGELFAEAVRRLAERT